MTDEVAGEGAAPAQQPPPRPPMSSTTPAPVLVRATPPRAARVAAGLWTGATVMGFVVVLVAFLTRVAGLDRVTDAIQTAAPGSDEGRRAVVAASAYWGSIAFVALVLVLEGLLAARIRSGGRGARVLGVVLVPLQLVGAVLTDALLALGDGYLDIATALGAAFAVAGLVVLLLPAVGRWLRSQREVRDQWRH